ncbi:UDP-4-amino-4,6-dideoxy-N-acetyl-beta-L-altrosamine transaminase [Endozoicomonas numazuensis]|uniref:Spore coat protein n=1 Tax=Endozoicomonas numazuensis TaxID=1137799 RepID=A0A081NCN1_9GAMM|nr:UDP-4-amino-4,6-dideoxy-N-acetyl-beta-L-altrosamine transaminase [Endozoicomonas numazuensis]KEQ16204.1 spore coat protein [Endozoicomonas numazuensis]
MIPYGQQSINDADVSAVVDVLQSDYITQGNSVPAFEKALATVCNVPHVNVVNSATSALHLACKALGLGPGDTAWTSPVTFVASANCIRYCGAQVDFVDIDPETFNLCPKRLAEKLSHHSKNGLPLPKLVIPVHMCGQSCDMSSIHKLAQQYGFKVLEDAAHAIGASYQGHPVGCCEYSDAVVFSFHPVKIVTTGEGGAVLTQSREVADRIELLRSHGITRDPEKMDREPDGGWYYQQLDLGFNYRMTDLQAALGVSQLKRLGTFIETRRQLAARYTKLLSDVPLKVPKVANACSSVWHLYVIRLKLEELSLSHKEVFEQMRDMGVGVNLHYIPVYQQPYYRQSGFQDFALPEAEAYYQEAMTLPLFPAMTELQQDTVIKTLAKILS